MKIIPPIIKRLLAGTIVLVFALSRIEAGTYTNNFDTPPPFVGGTLLGNAADPTYDMTTGGISNSGCLKLTTAIGSQNGGSFIIDDFDSGATIGGFDATFQLYIGSGNGADGCSFAFGDFADAAWAEEGPGTINGLTISFDVFNNGGTQRQSMTPCK